MNFDSWWKENEDRLYVLGSKEIAKQAWQAAQQAERERTIGIMLKHVGSSMRPWNECVADAIDEINELDT